MTEYPVLFSCLFVLAGWWSGYAHGWFRACVYRDKLEAKYPRVPVVVQPTK